jgi:predicted ferric reductase
MDVLTYYSIGFSAMWAVPLLPGLYALFCQHVVPLFRRQLAKARYQRIGGLTRLHLFRGATCVELLLLSAYIAGNGVAVALKAIKGATVASSAALAASINLIPLLLGGRTSRVADVIGVSRPVYYAAHHWIGRTAIAEGLVHAAIGLHAVAQGQALDPIAVSGCMVSPSSRCNDPELTMNTQAAGSFLAVFLLSLPRLRRMQGAAFHGVHRILYLAGMAGLIWHVLLTQSVLHEILVFVACGLWLLSHVYRVVARWRSAEVTEKWSDSEVTRLRLKTQRPVAAFPGSYFYLYLPGSYLNYNLMRSSAVMMLCSDMEQTVTGKTTDFHILAGRQSRYLRQLRTIEKGDRMLLDGPYGQDLHLYRYETVILTAKGIGIVSVLPMALHLAARKSYDDSVRSRSNLDEDPTLGLTAPRAAASVFRDATRRIDLLWRLEHNNQDQWVADQLKALQDLDPRRVMLMVWCIYPKPQARDPPFQQEPHWVAVYPAEGQTMAEAEAPYSFEKALSHEVLMPGKCIVVGMNPLLANAF